MTPNEQTISEILSIEDYETKMGVIMVCIRSEAIEFGEWFLRSYANGSSVWTVYSCEKNKILTMGDLYDLFLKDKTTNT
jgi:hypothetical protein